jgi:pimeloyl-ACP methyl ester carboxylesterase
MVQTFPRFTKFTSKINHNAMLQRFHIQILIIGLLSMTAFSKLQAQAIPGTFPVGEQDVSFTDNGLQTPSVSTHVWYPGTSVGTGVPVAADVFPVIAFGHGFNLNYLNYGQICGHLASWGYIVISPDVQNGFSVSHLEFAKELAACLSHIQSEGSNSSSPFFQHVDPMTGVIGHSMGGGASGLVPSVYPNIDAVCGLAAAETNPSAVTALGNYNGPYQVISGSSDNTAPENANQTPMYNAALGTKQWVSITGGAHCKFTDGSTICDLVSSAGSVTRAFQVMMTRRYATAFFNYHLKGLPSSLTFLCGDSLQADITAGNVTSQTNHNCNLMGIPSISGENDWIVSPNPFTSKVRLIGTGNFVIHDAMGRAVFSGFSAEGSTELDLSSLRSGVYFLSGDGMNGGRVLVRE